MNDNLLAAAVVDALKLDSDLLAAIPNIFAGLSGEICNRPSLVVMGEFTPFGTRRKGTLTLELRTRQADEPATGEGLDHGTLVAMVWEVFFGAVGADAAATRANEAVAKAAMKSAVSTGEKVELIEYGPDTDAISSDTDGEDFRTVVSLRAAFAHLPV